MYYLDIRVREERRRFMEKALAIRGVTLKPYYDNESLAFTLDELIESTYPIVLDYATLDIDYLRVPIEEAKIPAQSEWLTVEKALYGLQYCSDDEIKAVDRFVDQPGQWISEMTTEQRRSMKKGFKTLEKELELSEVTEWIFPCDLEQYDLYKAFEDLPRIEWRAKAFIKKGDVCYIYISHSEKAVRFKCLVTSDIRERTTIDDSKYGGQKADEEYSCVEIELLEGYGYPGIRYEDLRKNGLKSSLQNQQRVEGKLLDYFHERTTKEAVKLHKSNISTVCYSLDNALIDRCAEQLLEKAIREQLQSNSSSTEISFSTGFFREQEWYKREVFDKAQNLLNLSTWKEESIGQGIIRNHVLEAMKMKMDSSGEQQNLIDWRDVDYFEKKLNDKLYESERVLYDLYKTEDTHQNNRHVFLRAIEIWGRKYSVITFLFFIKDRNRYAVVRADGFRKRFERLGIKSGCLNMCSWDNYQVFIAVLKYIRSRIERFFGEVELIDAHSFVWMMWMLDNKDPDAAVVEMSSDNELETSVVRVGSEGLVREYYGRRYERNPRNREAAISLHGYKCQACGFDFEKVYGEIGKGFIEVHHNKPLFLSNEETTPDPITDLNCLCSNCHRMIHRKKNYVLSVDELREIIRKKS